MKLLRFAALLLCLPLLFCACASPDTGGVDKPAGGIVSVGPSNTEILVGLGLGEEIVAADDYSRGVDGLPETVLFFDMITPDVERLLELEPGLMLVSGMTSSQGSDPYKPIADAGVLVVYLPSSDSLAGIQEDILEIARITGAGPQGEAMVAEMQAVMDEVAATAASIPEAERRTVYFEIGAAPNLYSFGGGVYLDELLTLAGCRNILAGEREWISVGAETVLEADPDVILTSVDYLPDPVEELCARPGWDSLQAVREGRVYQVNTDWSSRPSQHVTQALLEISNLVYPEHYGQYPGHYGQ